MALQVAASDAARTSDVRSLLAAQLDGIGNRAAKAKSADAVTKAHWQMLARQIEAGLKELK